MLSVEPWLRTTANFVEAYLRAIAKTSTVRFYVYDSDELIPLDATALESQLFRSSTILVPFWNAHSLLLITCFLSSPEVKEVSKRLKAVADDSLGGELTRCLLSHLGLPTRQLRIRSIADRLSDMRALLEDTPPLIMAADSHGPYRAVNSGMARLAHHYGSEVRPVSVVCDRTVSIFRHIRMGIPMPGSTIIVAIGARLGGHNSVERVRMSLHSSLVSLEAKSAAILSHN